MKVNLLVASIAGTACAMAAAAKPPVQQLQTAGPAVQAEPIQMAAVQRGPNGEVIQVGDWVDCSTLAPRGAPYNAPQWDGYGRGDGPASVYFPPGTHCVMCDGADTNLGPTDEGSRWYFGAAYHNPRSIDNIESFVGNACNPIDEINGGFFIASPPGTQTYIVVFTLEEFNTYDVNTGLCTSSFTGACGGNGVIFNFGVGLGQNIFYAWQGTGLIAANINMLMPADDNTGDGLADGSYEVQFLTTGNVNHPGPIQPMLWGTGEDMGESRPGTHNVDSYDDDGPTDGSYSQAECYDYTFPGYCASPFCKMLAFLAPYCPADYNRDGFVDASDYDTFVADFNNGDPAIQGRTDINDDCFADASDYDVFVAEFESLCP